MPLDKRVSRRYPTSVGRISGEKRLGDFGSFKVTRPSPKGGRNLSRAKHSRLRGEAAPPYQLRERPNTLCYSNLRFDNAGDYGFLTLTLSQGERGQRRWERQQAGNRKEPIRPLPHSRSMAFGQCRSLSIGRGLHPSTNSFRRVSICSGFWWWVSMIFTTAEPRWHRRRQRRWPHAPEQVR